MKDIHAAMAEYGVKIQGNLLLVQRVEKQEITTKSGIVIADASKDYANTIDRHAPTLIKVLVAGADVPKSIALGDIALVGPHAVQWFSSFPGMGLVEEKIGLVKEDEIQIHFGQNFEEYRRTLERP